jgi:predicted small lipoprotein YifL
LTDEAPLIEEYGFVPNFDQTQPTGCRGCHRLRWQLQIKRWRRRHTEKGRAQRDTVITPRKRKTFPGCGGCPRLWWLPPAAVAATDKEEEEEETRKKGRAQRDTVIEHPGKAKALPPLRWLPPAAMAATDKEEEEEETRTKVGTRRHAKR